MKRLVMLFAVALLTTCTSAIVPADMQAVAENYFTAIRSGDIDGALTLYDAEFYAITPRNEWGANLRRVSDKLGKMQSHKLLAWRVQRGVGTTPGILVELKYTVVYANYPAEELIIVRRSSGDAPKIIGHNINSPGLSGELTVHLSFADVLGNASLERIR